ncbi:FliH/SctL family protein [Nocardioides sp. YIM 152315]|uniref:FliH/SctL family protein n=1 Tax=Nocardioides sp. YIM 152315 TaxID=3031760 RepID=UPI0023DBD5E3|nr:FliH/SctL family protein [Nocardioides sp. YIM 152315]MDF1605964.1 FliH/SctL family protein [Nocardioides sp. YIM 152315]
MSEALTHEDLGASELRAAPWHSDERPDLRQGVWTRLGDERVLGDAATESVLGRLAERARSAAQAQGYAVGWSAGQQAALRRQAEDSAVAAATAERLEAVRAREHAAAVEGLRSAAAALDEAAAQIAAHIGEQATDLAFEVTAALLGHELSLATDPGAGAVARAISALPTSAAATVRLHPQSARSVAAAGLGETGVDVVADPTLGLHDAVVETDTTAVDLRLSAAMDRLREVLS